MSVQQTPLPSGPRPAGGVQGRRLRGRPSPAEVTRGDAPVPSPTPAGTPYTLTPSSLEVTDVYPPPTSPFCPRRTPGLFVSSPILSGPSSFLRQTTLVVFEGVSPL